MMLPQISVHLDGAVGPADAIVKAASRIRSEGMTVSSLGNVSVRRRERVWITPTRVIASDLTAGDVVAVNIDGRQTSAGTPSRELPLHLAIYRSFSEVVAVVHTHSPWATAWSHLRESIVLQTEELAYHGLSQIPCANAAESGSRVLADRAVAALAEAPVALLGCHGVVAMAGTLDEAVELCALAEQQAHINWLLRMPAASSRTETRCRCRSTSDS